MGIAKKTDGRYVVGLGVTDANDYKGSASYRDIYIQLTESGATAKSEEYLTFLKDYGFHANASGEPIMPPSVNVWISNNGVTTAVEADDVSIDGANYTICGIKWDGSAWDYSNAGQGSGGGSGSGLPSYTSADKGKVLTVGEGSETVQTVIVPEQTVLIESGNPTAQLSNVMPLNSNDIPEESYPPTVVLSRIVSGQTFTVIPENVYVRDALVGDYYYNAAEHNVCVKIDTYDGTITTGIYNENTSSFQPTAMPGEFAVKMTANLPEIVEKWNNVHIIYISSATGNNDADYGIFTDASYSEQLSYDECRSLIKTLKNGEIIGRVVYYNRSYHDYRCYWMSADSDCLFLAEMSNGSVEFKTVGFIERQDIPSD